MSVQFEVSKVEQCMIDGGDARVEAQNPGYAVVCTINGTTFKGRVRKYIHQADEKLKAARWNIANTMKDS